jgi:hypothetical protein
VEVLRNAKLWVCQKIVERLTKIHPACELLHPTVGYWWAISWKTFTRSACIGNASPRSTPMTSTSSLC